MNQKSHDLLKQAHPLLVKLFLSAEINAPVQFEISEVARTPEKQAKLKAAGASKTLNSRHIPTVPKHRWYGEVPVSHAVDVYCVVDGQVRWDWPLYVTLAKHIKAIAAYHDIDITWGGDWKSLRDGPHYELSRRKYP